MSSNLNLITAFSLLKICSPDFATTINYYSDYYKLKQFKEYSIDVKNSVHSSGVKNE